MRHFRSILYAVVLAPTVWVLVAVGLTRDLTTRGRDGFAVESTTGLLLVVLGGAAYGIVVFAPISPLGPTLAGLGFLGAGVWALSAPAGYAAAWPPAVMRPDFDLSRPGYGLAFLLAVPLLMTVLSARRWAGYEPPVLPIVGQLGRARGHAAAPGVPAAVLETTVLETAMPPGGSAAGLDTTVVVDTSEGQPADVTLALATAGGTNRTAPPVVAGREPGDGAAGADREPIADREPVVEAQPTAGSDGTSRPEGGTGWRDGSTGPGADASAERTTVDVPTPVAPPGGQATGERTGSDVADGPASPESAPVADPAGGPVAGEKTTASVAAEKPTVHLHGSRAVDESADSSTPDVSDEDATRVLSPLRSDAGSAGPPTEVVVPEQVAADETQVIRLPSKSGDDERTQVIRAGLVLPPGERTEVIRLPVTSPAPPVSIAGAESPAFGDDPTSRILPPGDRPDEPTRSMTVMRMERPPDEVPTQRRPAHDEE